ncbi:SMR family transporter [Caldisalinibacter kiritimatiensis]|uniref:Integral membrane protein n=1 Tax=Caldisalinibacter kiritimatiensis TaxID=1304284 RepID=R1CUR8_9FIRM|nr:SMR family transporter [Caldisalinibacter kiritimatiensis]EOD00404.1 Integral membrane protein [Caldisalinibacter kiritimatiensis]
MIYLLLAIVCSSLIAIIFKYSETNDMNRYAVTTANYFMAFTVSLIMSLKSGLFKLQTPLSLSKFLNEVEKVIFTNKGHFSLNSSIIWAIIVGVIAGIFFFLAFIYYQKSVKEDGVGLAGTFSKLGILVPMTLSIILWRELPTSVQWIGIILSITSIGIVNISFERDFLNSIRLPLILLFIFGGLAEFSNKIFQKYAIVDYKSLFLFFVFFTAFIISLLFTIRKKRSVTKRDIITGFMVGVPNLFSSFFLIMALNYIKTSVAFPVYSAGTIVIISLSGFILFKEKLEKKEIASIIMTIIALILINLK